MIVLNVASSGISTLLLPGGKATHSTSFDCTLKDLMRFESIKNMDEPFSGKVVILGRDFRQTFLVVRKGPRQEVIAAAVNSSKIQANCKVLKLTHNMRISTAKIDQSTKEIKEFVDWILKIGDGDINSEKSGDDIIDIPNDLFICDTAEPLMSLVDFVYPKILENIITEHFFKERAIRAPTLEAVEEVNQFILSLIEAKEKEYLSSDTLCHSNEDSEIHRERITSEFLNEIICSGVPNHRLKLKVGVPIFLLRNIDQASGLCNGTRLQVKHVGNNIIKAIVITRKNIKDTILRPMMDLIPSDPGFPFKFQWRQFPICLCFAMTINSAKIGYNDALLMMIVKKLSSKVT